MHYNEVKRIFPAKGEPKCFSGVVLNGLPAKPHPAPPHTCHLTHPNCMCVHNRTDEKGNGKKKNLAETLATPPNKVLL